MRHFLVRKKKQQLGFLDYRFNLYKKKGHGLEEDLHIWRQIGSDMSTSKLILQTKFGWAPSKSPPGFKDATYP